MKKNVKTGFRNRFSQTIDKFLNIFTFCSRQPTVYIIENSSYSNKFLISTPCIVRSNIYLSPKRRDHHLKLSSYPTTFTSIDQVCCICQES